MEGAEVEGVYCGGTERARASELEETRYLQDRKDSKVGAKLYWRLHRDPAALLRNLGAILM